MSCISAINSVTKKYFLPIEIENIIFEYLKLEDYNKARAKFNKNFLNRMSPKYPSLTLFNGILGDIINIKEQFLGKFPIMRYIYRKSEEYLRCDTDFYKLFEYYYDDCPIEWYENEFEMIDGEYNLRDEDDAIDDFIDGVDDLDDLNDLIVDLISSFDNIKILAEKFRRFRCKYSIRGKTDYNFLSVYFKYNDVVYKNKILED